MQGLALPPTTTKNPLNMLRNLTYLFCLLGLFVATMPLGARERAHLDDFESERPSLAVEAPNGMQQSLADGFSGIWASPTSFGFDPTYEGCLVYHVGKAIGEQGDIVCVDVSIQGFEEMAGNQYSIEWDPTQLAFIEVRDFTLGNTSASFGVSSTLLEQGKLTVAWIDPNGLGKTLSDGEVVYSLCFEVLADAGFAPIGMADSPTAIESVRLDAATFAAQVIPTSFLFGGIQIAGDLEDTPKIEQICVEGMGCGVTASHVVSAEVQGGTPPYAYAWSGPDNFTETSSSFAAPAVGVYNLTVTDVAGASATGLVRVVATEVGPEINAEIEAVSCLGNGDGRIAITTDGSFSYNWSNGATTNVIDELAVGEYTVTITDSETNCTFVKRFQVEKGGINGGLYYNCVDSVTTTVTAVVFEGQSPSYTFTWSDGTVETASHHSTVSVAVGDSISVVITDALGCAYTSQVLRPVCSDTSPNTAITANWAYECAEDDQNVALTALVWNTGTGPYGFTWSTGDTETDVQYSTITVPAGGTYQVTITDGLGQTKVLGNISPDCQGQNETPLEFSIGEANAVTGESVCLAVRAKNFTNTLGFQYAVGWDPDALELNSIQNYSLPNLDGSNFNLGGNNYENGLLRFAWIDPSSIGVTLPDDAILYEMCFTVTGTEGEIPVYFDEASMQVEFVNEQSASLVPILDDGLVIINGEQRVWPGDSDYNEVANHFDVLNLGLAYGATGPIRPDANLIWRGQWAPDWGQTTPATDIDYKHIDTNGDGVINIADTTAISINWGRAVNLSPNPMTEYRSSPDEIEMQGAPIYIEAHTVRPGETVTFDVKLGDSDNPIEGAYGLAFTVVYDPLAVVYGSAKASFQNSWLGELGTNMIALVKDDPSNHRLHIGMTRIDQLDVNGNGAIGQISMTIEDVIFRDTEYEMPFRVENVRLIRTTEEEIQISQKQTIGTVSDTPLDVEDLRDLERVKLFPNPTTDVLNIQYESIQVDGIQILSPNGQLLREYKAMNQISLRELPPSTYLLRFISAGGVFFKKVVKQ